MATMNVGLPADLASFVDREVQTGEYGSASEVVREGPRLLRREREVAEAKAEVLHREVGLGLADAQGERFPHHSAADIARSVLEEDSRGA